MEIWVTEKIWLIYKSVMSIIEQMYILNYVTFKPNVSPNRPVYPRNTYLTILLR